ncbi:hypothetical protein KKJ06_19580 [Xenorhabdus bovienii]|uniref:hypothetical protein n=1 Tax=Xenorhabdus bovienii TaxID=40576 RepID=UPI0023B29B77|nr:hypothetical protein [Xenorhabdus bovienii]MDE9483465.1 hypothetical protein [Xenorhabdus bovienii]MDE9557564.1 hypothetical protein [Xenorhabdus bovienii]
MLKGYFDKDYTDDDGDIKKHKRLLAVQAALEIAKASATASVAHVNVTKVENDLKYTASKIKELADAIQNALE